MNRAFIFDEVISTVGISRYLVSAVLWIALHSHIVAAAEVYDIGYRTGGAGGTISFTDEYGDHAAGFLGGVPFGLTLWSGLTPKWSLCLGGDVLLDLINSQLIRQGVFSGFAYHILGGPRVFRQGGDRAELISTSKSSFSAVTYAGFRNFSASSKKNAKIKVSGSVLEVDAGLQYYREINDVSGVSAEIITTVYSLPASVSRIMPQTLEMLITWRTLK